MDKPKCFICHNEEKVAIKDFRTKNVIGFEIKEKNCKLLKVIVKCQSQGVKYDMEVWKCEDCINYFKGLEKMDNLEEENTEEPKSPAGDIMYNEMPKGEKNDKG